MVNGALVAGEPAPVRPVSTIPGLNWSKVTVVVPVWVAMTDTNEPR